ncbi:MAG: CDP-alcohol phosphatidyltransferase family protein [Sphingosinicella sp.]|uniref:CDP-alcohol phosphatidyltransferase family protein n=1 Tax=Sphingosinicella sp. TaxID=1917971 RepID=UPI0040379556
MEREEAERPGGALLAWLVHLFTASGAVLALLALAAIEERAFNLALLWLVIALAIDGVDGTLARAARVKHRLPRIDGAILDLVIDYLTYVFVPTLFIWRAGLLPEPLVIPLAAAIQISALYVFARAHKKTEDGNFRGFPAVWNVVALYLYVTLPDPRLAATIVGFLVLASFAPIHFVHPFRVRDYGVWLPLLAVAWAAATAALLWPDWPPAARGVLVQVSVVAGLAIIGLGLLRSLRGPRLQR